MTTAAASSDGLQRFINSAQTYGIEVKVISPDKDNQHKFKDELDLHNDGDIVVFVDNQHTVFASGTAKILNSFKDFNSDIVFPKYEMPLEKLASLKPQFIGYVSALKQVLLSYDLEKGEQFTEFYNKGFLDKKDILSQLSFSLDSEETIFQNIDGALNDIEVRFDSNTSYLYNIKTGNTPHIVHGSDENYHAFNNITNYVFNKWTPDQGCPTCDEIIVDYEGIDEEFYPSVLIAVFFNDPTPFLNEFLENLFALVYPKQSIDLLLHVPRGLKSDTLNQFIGKCINKYKSIKVISSQPKDSEMTAFSKALLECDRLACRYILALDSLVQIEQSYMLNYLLETNHSVVAPMFPIPGSAMSNFFYSPEQYAMVDYTEIVQYTRKGQWIIPKVNYPILVHGHVIPTLLNTSTGAYPQSLPEMCKTLETKKIHITLDNQHYFGHLGNKVPIKTKPAPCKHNDLFAITRNQYLWEQRYLHPDYVKAVADDFEVEEPCPGVFWFPLVTEQFCKDMIEEVNCLDIWSKGSHNDSRLESGFEAYPTIDVRTDQMGFHEQWLKFSADYLSPMAFKVFDQYYSMARSNTSFVARYMPGEQDSLAPHHDGSTYSINIALNKPGVDFTGGGTRFLRTNCSIVDGRLGWAIMHPGKLTHRHEGLKTTSGIRYIMVAFVDP